MLVHEPTADLCVDEALRCPALHEEARKACPALAAHAEPAGAEAVARLIGREFAVFPQPDRSKAEWEAFWLAYCDDLQDIPLEALEAGIRDARRQPGAEFLTKPGPLRALCTKHAQPIRQAAYRAKRIAESLPRPAVTTETLEERRRMAADVLGSLHVRGVDE